MKLRTILPVIVSLVGIVVAIGGWVLNIAEIRAIWPGHFFTMKMTTAVCFISAGAMLFFANQRKVNYPVVAVFSIGMAYIIAVTWSVASDILYESYDWTVHTLHPGLSSIGTTICILALVHVGVMESTHRRQCNGVRTFTAIILFSVAILTVIGYITGNYYLAFFWPKISTGVTLHTAACFILLGWAIMIPVVFPLHSSEMIVSHNGQRFVRPLSSTSRLYSPSDN